MDKRKATRRRARLAADLYGDPPLGGGQASGALRVGTDESAKGLGERAAGVACVLAVEPPQVHGEANAPSKRSEIGGPVDVGRVRRGAAPSATAANGSCPSRAHHEQELTVDLPHSLAVAPKNGIRGQRHAWCYPTLALPRRTHRCALGRPRNLRESLQTRRGSGSRCRSCSHRITWELVRRELSRDPLWGHSGQPESRPQCISTSGGAGARPCLANSARYSRRPRYASFHRVYGVRARSASRQQSR